MPTVDIPDRICSHCGGTKWLVKKNSAGYTVHKCYAKNQAYMKRYSLSDKGRANSKRYKVSDKGKKAAIIHSNKHRKKYREIHNTDFYGYMAKSQAARYFKVLTSQLTQDQFNQYSEYIKTLRLWRQLQAKNN